MLRTRKKRTKHFPQADDVWKAYRKFRFHIWGKDRWLYMYKDNYRAQRGFDDRFILVWENSNTPILNKAYVEDVLSVLEKILESPGYWYSHYK